MNATFHLPGFLPSAGKYLVIAWAHGGAGLIEQAALLAPGESASIPIGRPGESGSVAPILPWIALGALVAAVAVVGTLLYLRRRKPEPPPPPAR